MERGRGADTGNHQMNGCSIRVAQIERCLHSDLGSLMSWLYEITGNSFSGDLLSPVHGHERSLVPIVGSLRYASSCLWLAVGTPPCLRSASSWPAGRRARERRRSIDEMTMTRAAELLLVWTSALAAVLFKTRQDFDFEKKIKTKIRLSLPMYLLLGLYKIMVDSTTSQ